MDNRPAGVFVARRRHDPPPPAQLPVPHATRLLLSEILACTEELWHTMERLDLELLGICRIMYLFCPHEFAALLRLSAAKDPEFLRQQDLVKKWATPGQETQYQELYERGNSLAGDGRRALQSPQEPGTAGEPIGIKAERDEVTVRRRHYGRRE